MAILITTDPFTLCPTILSLRIDPTDTSALVPTEKLIHYSIKD